MVFPVGRIHRKLKKGNYSDRVGEGASVFMAGVLEYLTAELSELAGNTSHANNKRRINPRHIMLAVHKDEELSKLFEHVTISEGGIVPNIQAVLLPKKTTVKKPQNEGEPSQEY